MTARVLARIFIVPSLVLLLSACGGSDPGRGRETVAKVNKIELTDLQIDIALQQQRGLKPEQTAAASRQVLEHLIDQEVAVQKADGLGIDRDPRVLALMDAARREILARAYAERISSAASQPGEEAVRAYYRDHPELFAQRRIYSIQEFAVDIPPAQVQALRADLGAAKSVAALTEHLRTNDIRFTAGQAVRAAEQLPFPMLKTLAGLKDGQAVVTETPVGAQIVILLGSREQPVTEEQARPAIEQFLLNDRKRQLIEADRLALRKEARIQYFGKYAEAAASTAATKP